MMFCENFETLRSRAFRYTYRGTPFDLMNVPNVLLEFLSHSLMSPNNTGDRNLT